MSLKKTFYIQTVMMKSAEFLKGILYMVILGISLSKVILIKRYLSYLLPVKTPNNLGGQLLK